MNYETLANIWSEDETPGEDKFARPPENWYTENTIKGRKHICQMDSVIISNH